MVCRPPLSGTRILRCLSSSRERVTTVPTLQWCGKKLLGSQPSSAPTQLSSPHAMAPVAIPCAPHTYENQLRRSFDETPAAAFLHSLISLLASHQTPPSSLMFFSSRFCPTLLLNNLIRLLSLSLSARAVYDLHNLSALRCFIQDTLEPGEKYLCTLNGDFLSPSLLSSMDLGRDTHRTSSRRMRTLPKPLNPKP